MCKYNSQGTVSYKSQGEKGTWVNFVPHGDYSVKHEGTIYAVFVDNNLCSILKSCQEENGIEIKILEGGDIEKKLRCSDLTVSKMITLAGAQSAATTHSKVEVEVANGTANRLELIGITVLAR